MLNKPLTFLILISSLQLVAQTIEKDYYMFPVRPGEVNYLSGTMGELRSGHFHTGLDIKTSGITGLPIFAAAEGYVQRAKVSLSGYGNALYLAHPNGTVTVYAHLKEFQEDIADYIRKEQYRKESYTVDISFPKDKFKFKKGDVIALSGNSGSSSGPHLHFELRDVNQKVLNPLTYGFKEIKDDIPPHLSKLAFVTMDKDSRVNGMFGRFEYDVVQKAGNYIFEVPVSLFGNIGIEVYAYDQFNGARNKNGILSQTLLFDFEPVFNQNIEKIEFNKQRNILAHINYKRSKEGGRRFNKYYVDDGNLLKFYDTNEQMGVISIVDPLEHSIDIQLEDSYQNMIQYHLPLNDAGYSKTLSQKDMYFLNRRGYDVRNNTLEILGDVNDEDCFARIFMDGREHLYAHSYKVEGKYFYLWDLRDGLPDSVDVCGKSMKFNFAQTIPTGQRASFSTESVDLNFPKNGLFDTLYLQYKQYPDTVRGIECFAFEHPDTPLRQSVRVEFKPNGHYDLEKSAVYALSSKGNLSYIGGKWNDSTIVFKTKDLLKFTIATDTIPPVIKRLKSYKSKLILKIKDKMSGIHSYRAEMNGEWVLMTFDAKNGLLRLDPKVQPKGKINLVVEDNAQNFTEFEASF